MSQQPVPIRKGEDPFAEDPPQATTHPAMQAAYWLFLLLVLIILGEFALMFVGDLTGAEARDLFFVTGIPVLLLFGCVIGWVLGHANKRL